jgi:hypothetical protein
LHHCSILAKAHNHHQNKGQSNSPVSLCMSFSWGMLNSSMCATDCSLCNTKSLCQTTVANHILCYTYIK